jgi:hypothetical protein
VTEPIEIKLCPHCNGVLEWYWDSGSYREDGGWFIREHGPFNCIKVLNDRLKGATHTHWSGNYK